VTVAIVTGSDSGIGKSSAVALAKAGFEIGVTWHRDEEGAADTAREVEGAGRKAAMRRLDLLELGDVPDVIEELVSELGGLDVFVNNAGTGHSTPFLDLDLGEWEQVMRVNLTGAMVAAQAAARRMVEDGTHGRIINITSVHEHIPKTGSAAYCAAKGGLGLLTKVMALELAEHGIAVNAIAPGEIATPMTEAEDVDPSTERRPHIPLGRPGHADEIAEAVVFLSRPEARYTTGASIIVDGGLTLIPADVNAEDAS
jgi:NAD(P)-dependent dehydrogenase (short-subunit alcohol dehydrogenase family)